MSRLGAWCAESEAGRRLSLVVIGCDVIGIVIGVVVVLSDVVRDRPVDGLAVLLVPAVPLLAAGQILAIGVFDGRMAPIRGNWSGWHRLSWTAYKAHWRAMSPVAGLPRMARIGVIGLAGAAWLSGMSVPLSGALAGNPQDPRPGCPYPINDHGSISCVTRSTFEHVGAADQRFGASVVVGFLVIHAAVLWSNRRISVPLPDGSAPYDAVGYSGGAGQQDDGE